MHKKPINKTETKKTHVHHFQYTAMADSQRGSKDSEGKKTKLISQSCAIAMVTNADDAT